MKRATIKEYARTHKLSIYNVIKMTREGKVKTETVEENGKEIVYILLDDEVEAELSEEIILQNPPKSLKEENAMLKAEIKRLKKELEKCKKGRQLR
jgi:uncharacterized small protein (DUF1192 family)